MAISIQVSMNLVGQKSITVAMIDCACNVGLRVVPMHIPEDHLGASMSFAICSSLVSPPLGSQTAVRAGGAMVDWIKGWVSDFGLKSFATSQ